MAVDTDNKDIINFLLKRKGEVEASVPGDDVKGGKLVQHKAYNKGYLDALEATFVLVRNLERKRNQY